MGQGHRRVWIALTIATAAGMSGCSHGSGETAKSSMPTVATESSSTTTSSQSSTPPPVVTSTITQAPPSTVTERPKPPTQPASGPSTTIIPTPDIPEGYKSCGSIDLNNISMPVMANNTTSCSFAQNTARDAETSQSVNISPYSPALKKNISMTCDIADGAGTCSGGKNATVAWLDSSNHGD